jgi:acetyltransferase-like isoleucine patch superfamily enzyme
LADTFIHDRALVETDCIGAGTRVWAFAHVMRDVVIGRNCNVGDHSFIESGVTIGDNVTIKNGVSIWQYVHIADNVFLGPNVALTNDRFPRSRAADWQPVETWIEEGATVGANATILCGIRLGSRCLVGAGAVVTCDVPPYAIVAGNPARHRGWACQCGRPVARGASGVHVCPHCGVQLIVTATGVERR